MPKDLKVGQRVRVYGFGPALDVLTGVVSRTYGERPIVSVDPGGGRGHIAAHVGQCRRLRPREKSVRVTRKMLAEAWDSSVAGMRHWGYERANSIESSTPGVASPFKDFARALGLDEARP